MKTVPVITLLLLTATIGRTAEVNFNRDIRPILAAKCFACHGPDAKAVQADLRLDQRDVALDLEAIVPGDADASSLVQRILSDDPDFRMPPPESGETLTDEQKQHFVQWIKDGATYEQHWAFVPPKRPALPPPSDAKWPRNEIDHFVLARLEASKLNPAPAADKYALVRRLYLDLIGLPPTPKEADAFVNDPDLRSYEKLVDRLLKSEHYGERWARLWLDLARYSDTNGYEKDRPRSIWPYRDWVIQALNADMPFDQFTIEQLAGDMLPDATNQQQIATGFHRNTMLNEEGGIDPLEYRFYAMVDRVATTGTVWLGLTTGCAQCHSHKYDPISHTDYYRLMALLNNAEEPDLAVQDANIAARREEISKQIAQLEATLPDQFPPAQGDGPIEERRRANLEARFHAWLNQTATRAQNWQVLRPHTMKTNLPKLELLDDGSIFSSGDVTKRDVYDLRFQLDQLADSSPPITALRLEVLPDDRLPAGGPGRAYYEGRKGDFFLSEVKLTVGEQPVAIDSASHTYGKIAVGSGNANATNVFDGEGSTGWSTAGAEGRRHVLVLNLKGELPKEGELRVEMLFERHFVASLGRFRLSAAVADGNVKAATLPDQVEKLLAAHATGTTDGAKSDELMRYFLSVAPELAKARKPIDRLRSQLPKFPESMVMLERSADNPRPTHRHHRGEFLSPREDVTPGVPAIFRSGDEPGPTNRLEFARWLASPKNPLVARVAVNRAWRAFFGSGLMRTSGDFGTQSDPPTHPELLDWLACEFMDQGWSLKKLHRIIVLSATYRQSSNVNPQLLRLDPQNRLLARGSRFRVDAEVVRDIMLRSSGLVSPKMFGPSVYPPQPSSVTAIAYGGTKWTPSTGEDRYRRSLYTFSKRTAPFAAYTVFDGPTGEICAARRNRSNTPLSALTLLNDDMYLEMARALARKAMEPEELSTEDRATIIFRRLLTRPPANDELSAILAFQQAQLTRLTAGELNPATIGGDDKATPESASWMMVARAIMNLDEVITKP